MLSEDDKTEIKQACISKYNFNRKKIILLMITYSKSVTIQL